MAKTRGTDSGKNSPSMRDLHKNKLKNKKAHTQSGDPTEKKRKLPSITNDKGAKRAAVAPKAEIAETDRERPKKKKVAGSDDSEEGEDDGKEKKSLNRRQTRRKEVTQLYSELTNQGRERKGEEIVEEILEMLSDRATSISEYISSKIGSRVVQACLKWGTRKQRHDLLGKLKEFLPKLSVDRFGHVVVLKLLTYAMKTAKDRKPTDEEKAMQAKNLRDFLEPFRGKHLHQAFYHKHGCKVINGIYFNEIVGAQDKRRLLHEVAVPQAIALLRPEMPGKFTLRQLMAAEDLTADQRKQICTHLREAAEKAVDKELLGCDITHFLFQAFCEQATEEQLKDLADKTMGGAPYLLSSKPGAEAMTYLLGVANAKQRKAICRDLKGKFVALAANAVDYVVMIRLATTVDDTVLLSKTMLAEWMQDMQTLCFDKYGSKVLAWFFKPADPRVFSPYEIKYATLPAPTSLKAAETRRQELVRVLRPPLRKVLMEAPLAAAADDHAKNLLIAYLAADWDAELVEALLKAAEAEREEKDLGLLNNGTTTTTLIALLRLEPAEAEQHLGVPLWKRCFAPKLTETVTSRCSFVLLELLKRTGKAREGPLDALKKQRKEVTAAVDAAEKAGAVVKGARYCLEQIDKK